ncbi:MAG TPA: acetyl-CoA carboxylase biotin carboxylase subunit [Terriglobales bacterium]|nr:acetyl-CoA carboxylase biotin carboxylase subunit [Terriglobales bacterium]
MFRKILIANRGEIALRIARACRELGIASVAVYSEVDRAAPHVLYCDEAQPLGGRAAAESYLALEKIMTAARRAGADALHPGYGFLSENPALPEACRQAGIAFIGPSAAAMERMGSKTAARALAREQGVPLLPGSRQALASAREAEREAAALGYPVMLKAAAGGGGKGMRLVGGPAEMESAYALATAEAQSAFGDGTVYLEKALTAPRHVEIQVLGDHHGQLIHLGERECSVQRRHQKVIEESPSPALTAEMRQRMGEAAVAVCRAAGYTNAGTVEFLVDAERNFYFLEVNARLQVEHPVTELVTGLDLVHRQIAIAAGQPLGLRQEDIHMRGHAIECRIYAEDPEQNFFPSAGTIRHLRHPAGPGVREDCGVEAGGTVPLEYDPMLSKLIVWGENRAQAAARMRRALEEYELSGVRSNLGLFRRIFADPEFLAGRLDTHYLERLPAQPAAPAAEEGAPLAIAAAAWAAAQTPAPAAREGGPAEHWRRAAREAGLR